MKAWMTALLAMLMALSLTACSGNGNTDNASIEAGDQPSVKGSSGAWTGTYTGDGLTLMITEEADGKLWVKSENTGSGYLDLLCNDFTYEGNTATSSIRISPEMMGGDMELEAARETFPDSMYEYTLVLDGTTLQYYKSVELSYYMGEESWGTQVEECSATLTKQVTDQKKP